MVSCIMLFCSPGISFKGKRRFKSTPTSMMVYLEQPMHNSVASSLICFLGGYPCISSCANQVMLWGVGLLLTSFSQLQSRHLGLGYHLILLCLLELCWLHLWKLHQTTPQDRRQTEPWPSRNKRHLSEFWLVFLQTVSRKVWKSPNGLWGFSNSEIHFPHKSNDASLHFSFSKIRALSGQSFGF